MLQNVEKWTVRYGMRVAVAVGLGVSASCGDAGSEPPPGQVTEAASERVTEAAGALGAAGAGVEDAAEVLGPAAIELSPAQWQALQARILAVVDTVDLRLRKVRGLSQGEKQMLRRDVNAIQIAYARQLGIQPTTNLDGLIKSGQLVRLAAGNRYWVVRELDYSVPYVTPSAEAMLVEIGRRFQARLDELNVPRYRLDITSVLRTQQSQAALRRANGNASRRESAHEFGTTVDIAYRKFAPPAPDPKRDGYVMNQQALLLRDSLMVKLSNTRSGELQAVLGRVLQEMQREGKLLVRMERRQTVYHITVARPLPPIRRASPIRPTPRPVTRAGS